LNFADYIFLRKCNLAFKTCADEGGIGARRLPCALAITSPNGKILSVADTAEVFSLVFILQTGQGWGTVSQISFTEFVGVAHLYYYFSEF